METTIQFTDLKQYKLTVQLIVVSVFGILGGIFFTYTTKLPLDYILIAEVGLFTVCLIALFKKLKISLLIMLGITLVINIDKTIFFHHGHIGGVSGLVISIWSIILLILYIMWFIERRTGKAPKVDFLPQFSIALILLILICLLSTLKAVKVHFSFFQTFQLSKVMLLFFYIANNIKTKKEYKLILTALVVAYIIEICIGFYQYYVNDYVELGILANAKPHKARTIGYNEIVAVLGTTSGCHRYASYLIMMLPLLLASLISQGKSLLKLLNLPLLLGGIMLLIYTFSRGGWLGFVVGTSLFFILYLFVSGKQLSTYLKTIVMLLIFIMSIYQFRDKIIYRITADDRGSAESRIPMMTIASEMIKANPILGVGFNNYSIAMPIYDPTGLSYSYLQPVHNTYLQLAAEIGIIGLLAFIVFVAMLYRVTFRTLRRTNTYFKIQIIGIICGITGLLIHNFVNNGTLDIETFILFWLFSGLIVAISKFNIQNET